MTFTSPEVAEVNSSCVVSVVDSTTQTTAARAMSDCDSLSSSSSSSSSESDEIREMISIMCQQECKYYRTRDYLFQPLDTASSLDEYGSSYAVDIDVMCRTKMIEWCYQVIEFCNFSKSNTCEIAVNYLDRYLGSRSGIASLQDRTIFQLAAMTCLYTAVKIHEPKAMDPKLVSILSRGTYSAEQIVATETCILHACTWNMNPPTTPSYIQLFLQLVQSKYDALVMDCSCSDESLLSSLLQEGTPNSIHLHQLIELQTEMAVLEYSFVSVPSNIVAYCAFINALQVLFQVPSSSNSVSTSEILFHELDTLVRQAIGLHSFETIDKIKEVLSQAIASTSTPPLVEVHHYHQHQQHQKRSSVSDDEGDDGVASYPETNDENQTMESKPSHSPTKRPKEATESCTKSTSTVFNSSSNNDCMAVSTHTSTSEVTTKFISPRGPAISGTA